MGFPGTLTLSAETIVSLALDICRSLLVHGFRKLILINGNRMVLQPLDIAAVKLRSEEHTSELQSLMRNSYAVFCFKQKRTLTSKLTNLHATTTMPTNSH